NLCRYGFVEIPFNIKCNFKKFQMKTSHIQPLILLLWLTGFPVISFAQESEINTDLWYTQPGIIGTIVLCIIVVLVFSIIMILRISKLLNLSDKKEKQENDQQIKDAIINIDSREVDEILQLRQQSGRYKLKGDELAGQSPLSPRQGLVQKVTHNPNYPLADEKKMGKIKIETEEKLIHLVLAHIVA